ncbi:MAG: methyltransferase domain-containing protein [Melioribacteraceae bacterium]|nr:methyltransferase domain-containing protein [Melioribacteraceae bacterium]
MFKNLVNINDFLELHLFFKRKRQIPVTLLLKIFSSDKNRTKSAWAHNESPPTHWWDIPEVRERWNFLITGNNKIDYPEYFKGTFLLNKEKLKALSLGSGTGHRELKWAASNKFERIDAIDLSRTRIEYAKKRSELEGYSDIINYQVKDFDEIENKKLYDIIFCEQSLHHFSPMQGAVEKIKSLLKTNGLLLINEYVGPNRFQWTKKQLFETNKLLNTIPIKYRTFFNSKIIKSKVYRPGLIRMILNDRSEAAESEQMLPSLNNYFSLIEIKEYGGTILHPLFNGIAHNFINSEKETKELLQKCFAIEDELLDANKIKSDFIFAVYKKTG